MFIQTESTPNSNALKFIPGIVILKNNIFDFASIEEASGLSPIAEKLFNIKYVTRVFLGYDFITITKERDADWAILKPQILTTIMDHLITGGEVVVERAISNHNQDAEINYDDKIVNQIIELIEERVRPAVAADGGDIVFRGFVNGVVKLELHGSCSGCPSSTETLKYGIENMLKHYVPEVESVESI